MHDDLSGRVVMVTGALGSGKSTSLPRALARRSIRAKSLCQAEGASSER
jgi:type II secretory ATPase GspE/PulE/Tfp pilus assembly ATPase PilB-like protein